MKIIALILSFIVITSVSAAVPTEEGLLKNLNNANISGNFITIKSMIHSTTAPAVTGAPTEEIKPRFYKFVFSLGPLKTVSLLQVAYSNGQMLNSQMLDVKYIPDVAAEVKKEVKPEKSLFYGLFMMLATNNSQGIENFLEKSGVQLVRNSSIINNEKMKLLKDYRTYLVNSKGKGSAISPLNPVDPQDKEKIFELFRSNTFSRSKNIELVKLENEFVWKVDWKNISGYFTNEERRLYLMEYVAIDKTIGIEATEYLLFNGINELPKFITVKDAQGISTKLQILEMEVRKNSDKKLVDRYLDAKKHMPASSLGKINLGSIETSYSFLF